MIRIPINLINKHRVFSAFARFKSGADLRSDEQVVKSGGRQTYFYKLTI